MPDQKDHIFLVCCADNTFAMGLAVMLFSVLDNLKKKIPFTFYILDGGIKKSYRKRIQQVVKNQDTKNQYQIKWVTAPLKSLKKLPTMDRISTSTYLRFLIPEILPPECKKVIYLDCDLIVKKDICSLWGTPIKNWAVMAVQDAAVPYVSFPNGVYRYRELGLKVDTPYFNSGVLVINLDYWRKECVSQKATDYLVKFRNEQRLLDQEALNIVLDQQWKPLDSRWNLQPHHYTLTDAYTTSYHESVYKKKKQLLDDPYIIHFASRNKPWDYNCQHPELSTFLNFLKRSSWFNKYEWKKWFFTYSFERFKWFTKVSKNAMNQLIIPK